MENKLKFNSIVKDVKLQKLNPLFTDAKVYVLYTGHNRNNSYFSKQAIIDSLHSIYNIPVIGEYLVEKDNFGGHGGKLEITDNDIKFIQTTVPYGVVPSDVKISWENVEESDGTVNEYLVLDGVKLWTSRYEELNVLLEQGNLGQSMEIEIDDGEFAIIDGKETFNINKFTFSALCMLGIDKGDDPDTHVEPCFESSKIVTYSLDKDKFKREFNQLLEELNYSLKGGKQVEENTNREFETTVETEVKSKEVTENVETTEDAVETEATNEQEVAEEFTEETQVEETVETEVVEDTTEEVTEELETATEEVKFELTHNQIRDGLRSALNKGSENHCEFEYWVVDYTDTYVVAEDFNDNCQLYKFDYKIENDKVTVDFNTKQKVKVEYVPFEGESYSYAENFERLKSEFTTKETEEVVNEFEVKYNDLVKEFETVDSELEELRAFKRNTEESVLSAKFEGQLSTEEIAQVFEQSKELPIEDIEKELFALVGKHNFSIKTEKKEKNSFSLNINKTEEKNPYGNFFE